MRTNLGMPAPDFSTILWIRAGFQSQPLRVCLQPPEQACPSEEPSPDTPGLNNASVYMCVSVSALYNRKGENQI